MNLIYQCWNGKITPEVTAGVDVMTKYANHIGVEYRFDHDTNYIQSKYGSTTETQDQFYGTLKPILDEEFDEYDKVMYVDVDIFPITKENIFDVFTGEVGQVPENFLDDMMPIHRERFEEWRSFHPYVKENLNAGLILCSKELRKKARDWVNLREYIDNIKSLGLNEFFLGDQTFLMQMFYKNGADIQLLDQDWNTHVFNDTGLYHGKYYCVRHDYRTPTTKFIHCRLKDQNEYREFLKEL